MLKIIIAGTGPDVGKTVVSAILTTLLNGSYWKPIQCGRKEESDTATMHDLIDSYKHKIYPPKYSLDAPLSPHHAARLEGISIDASSIVPPETTSPLIVEGVGGIFVPLTTKILTIDLFSSWKDCLWILVSNHYIGSINHTLLTVEALKRRQVSIAGLIFNGKPNPDSEEAILDMTQLPLLERLLPEKYIALKTIKRYANQWQHIRSRLAL
ncbi:MAG: dethiobiotin synthase [Parachlamydiaceae bacterium]|nr:dethiobiotin synthase [Parachlamydiaceae bacterium]